MHMKRSDVRILIVEDDPTLGRAIDQILKRRGYETRHVTHADQALAAFKLTDFHLAIIDCMIPKVSGLDLAKQLRKIGGDKFQILLTSGIYRDRQFIRDAVFESRASGYLVKPFDLEELLNTVDKLFEADVESENEQLFALLSQARIRPSDALDKIAALESIHGFDLSYIYPLLMLAKVTGELHLRDPEDRAATVYFNDGRIVQLKHYDTESYFGVLLVEKGFTSAQEVEDSLALPSSKRIGERLVDTNSLSPHAINIVQVEQMAIRLSKTIANTSYHLEFKSVDVEDSEAFIDEIQLKSLAADWVVSKIHLDWLKSSFISWMDHQIIKGPEFERLHLIRHLPALNEANHLLSHLHLSKNLQDLLDQAHEPDEIVYRAFYFLFVTRTLAIEDKAPSAENFEAKLKRLRAIEKDQRDKDHFEVLGISTMARSSEINRAYHDLAKVLHPDKLSPHAPAELRALTEKVFSRMTEAYDVLKDQVKRGQYAKSLEMGKAEDVLEQENKFDKARNYLTRGRYKEAYDIYERLHMKKNRRPDLLIYLLWAKIKLGTPNNNNLEEFIKDVERLMYQIPPEERHNANYFFVKGLFNKLLGNIKKSATYFRHAYSIDHGFKEARQELAALKKQYGISSRKKQTFVGELTSIIFTRKAK